MPLVLVIYQRNWVLKCLDTLSLHNKTTLVIAIIQKHHMLLEKFKRRIANENPLQKNTILSVYAVAKSEGRISILGALSNDYYSFEPEVQAELKILTDNTLNFGLQTL